MWGKGPIHVILRPVRLAVQSALELLDVFTLKLGGRDYPDQSAGKSRTTWIFLVLWAKWCDEVELDLTGSQNNDSSRLTTSVNV